MAEPTKERSFADVILDILEARQERANDPKAEMPKDNNKKRAVE